MSDPGSPVLHSLLVVGTGLIGTSIGLAARHAGVPVYLQDVDRAALALAVDLGAGTSEDPPNEPELVVLAMPLEMLAKAYREQRSRHPKATITDVASVKSQAVVDVDVRFVGGHPMAGRERSGAMAARADLFVGRVWG